MENLLPFVGNSPSKNEFPCSGEERASVLAPKRGIVQERREELDWKGLLFKKTFLDFSAQLRHLRRHKDETNTTILLTHQKQIVSTTTKAQCLGKKKHTLPALDFLISSTLVEHPRNIMQQIIDWSAFLSTRKAATPLFASVWMT